MRHERDMCSQDSNDGVAKRSKQIRTKVDQGQYARIIQQIGRHSARKSKRSGHGGALEKAWQLMNKPHGPGKPFLPGNKHGKGRPAGSRNKATIALQELLDGEGASITRKAIALAKAGNEMALRLCLE